MEADYNFDFSGVRFMLEELSLFGFTLLIGIGAALIPGLQAYFIPLSKELANG